MEVDEEVDSKKLDQRKKELPTQLRDIEKFTDVPQEVGDVLSEKWQQELQDIVQRRNDLLPEHQHTEEVAKVAEFTRQKRNSATRIWANELRIEKESIAEARGFQARDERRGTNASQSNGCCSDTTLFQKLFAMGTEQALQRMSAMQRQLT